MIQITIQEKKDDFLVEVTGHAGYANAGKDIICAAVSTLLCTLVVRLEELHIDGIVYSLEEGNSKIEFDNTKESKQVMGVIMSGWNALKETYPEYIGINRGEIKK